MYTTDPSIAIELWSSNGRVGPSYTNGQRFFDKVDLAKKRAEKDLGINYHDPVSIVVDYWCFMNTRDAAKKLVTLKILEHLFDILK